MRDKISTMEFYCNKLGFERSGGDFPDYLMVKKDDIEIHFFLFKTLDPKQNYGQVYIRVTEIEGLYQNLSAKKVDMPIAGRLEMKPWGQQEFSVLDPDHNLLTFGQSIA